MNQNKTTYSNKQIDKIMDNLSDENLGKIREALEAYGHKEDTYWYALDQATKMYAICSEARGGFFIYSPDEKVVKAITAFLNAINYAN